MTDIVPVPNWGGVRQLETNEYATGGFNGNMNEQAKSLASQNMYSRLYAGLPFDPVFTAQVGGFPIGGKAALDNGDIVKSTVANNIVDPNVDMTSWVKTNLASQIIDASGNSQQDVNDAVGLKTQYVTIQMFGGANDHERFRNAIASNRHILVTAGDYIINNNDINKMLTHKNGQFIHFEDGARIFFDFNGMPLFNCINSSGGGLTGHPEFIFTGTSQIADTHTKAHYLAATGLSDIVLGGNQELRSVIIRINCTNHKLFDSVYFHSSTDDINHGICFCINDKGNMINYVDGNTIGDCKFENHIHGILTAAQRNFRIGDMVSQKRWSHPSVAPGHVIYLTGSPTNGYLKDGTVGKVSDLGNSLDENVTYNLAPIAPKGCINVQFGSVVSHHYSGLIQSMTNCRDCTFEKMVWRYDGTNADTQPHVNISGGTSTNITLDIEVDAPNVAFKYSETSDTQLNNSTVKAKIRCKQQPSASASANSQMFRSSSDGTDYDIDWTPTGPIGAYYVMPFEEIAGITATNKNTIRLMLRGSNLVASSTRVITRADTSVFISSEKPISRDITFQPYPDFGKRTFNTNVYKYNKSGISTSGSWVETFQIPAEGMFILSLSAYVTGGSGHSSAWLLNYTPTLGIRAANQISVSQETASPKVTITSVVVDNSGLITLTFNKTTADASTLNVNLTKVGTLY